jgi:hypothetical protein
MKCPESGWLRHKEVTNPVIEENHNPQGMEKYGRPVRARTADLHVANSESEIVRDEEKMSTTSINTIEYAVRTPTQLHRVLPLRCRMRSLSPDDLRSLSEMLGYNV